MRRRTPIRAKQRFPLGLTVAVAIAFAILAALGTWQVQRLHWKEALLARVAALRTAPAQPLGPVLARIAAGADLDDTRVSADCSGLAAAPFVELYSIHDGQAGWRLLSPCRVAAGGFESVLVDRGFVPDTVKERPPVDPASTAAVRLVGVLHAAGRGNPFSPPNSAGRWYRADVPAMASALKAPRPAPLVLIAERADPPDAPMLVAAPVSSDIPNNHLGYAITWYGLAAALLGVYAAMLRRAFRPRNQTS